MKFHSGSGQLALKSNPGARFALGTMMFGWKVPLLEAHRIVDCAIENGIDLLDTSPTYGDGLSEHICGLVLGKYKDFQIRISTKFKVAGVSPNYADYFVKIRQMIESSLSRLKAGTIDIYVLHSDTDLHNVNYLCEAIVDLKRLDYAKRFFISNCSFDTFSKIRQFEQLEGIKILDGFQLKRNLLFADPLFSSVGDFSEYSVHSYSPLCEGVLTGKYLGKSSPPLGSRLSEASRHRDYYDKLMSSEISDAVAALAAKASERGLSLFEYSIGTLLSSGKIEKIIFGTSRETDIRELFQALDRIGSSDKSGDA